MERSLPGEKGEVRIVKGEGQVREGGGFIWPTYTEYERRVCTGTYRLYLNVSLLSAPVPQ